MTEHQELSFTDFRRRQDVTPLLRQDLIDCWVEVTNAGGAAGFPFPPVTAVEVAAATDAILAELQPQRGRLLIASCKGALTGWVLLRRDPNPLICHWGSVHHLQSRPGYRGRGIGVALMRELHRVARDELGLEQLHLAVRGRMGLEDFYCRLGWREVGRWPNKLRLAPDDTRDEVLMMLNPL
ncbi:GNAT family N-acetyltransferase [Salinispora vitiensis]|uniref:GNAT family N-acetyltransferase n=1 Tax=Salinispora vitiensis TaxID=999544 RepID=UPI00039F5C49|nr:GNAT family N-acetyltransferase [Salinispora vitiensis]